MDDSFQGTGQPEGTTSVTATQTTVTPASAMQQLVDWSETLPLSHWQRDGLRRLYSTCPLLNRDEEELFLVLKKQHGLIGDGELGLDPVPIDASHVPSMDSVSASVTIGTISEVNHVNALANDQKVHFEEQGLTIIFGNNGSGKSGYARILKTVCRARSAEEILHNVYDTKPVTPASAKLLYSVGGTRQPVFDWKNGEQSAAPLSHVSFFDSKCAPIHVDEKNEAAYTPLPLFVLKELSDTCRRFKTKLQDLSTTLDSQIPAPMRSLTCSRQTKAGKFLHGLTAASSYEEAKQLAGFSETEVTRIQTLKDQLQADPQKAIATEEAKKGRINAIAQRIAKLESSLNDSTVSALRVLLDTAHAKSQAALVAATDAFQNEPLEGIGSETWKALWESARRYSETEAYRDAVFPHTTDAVCVLCQQPLEAGAERQGRFEAFIKANSQKAADEAQAELNQARRAIESATFAEELGANDVQVVGAELGDSVLSAQVQSFYDACAARRDALLKALPGAEWIIPQPLPTNPAPAIQKSLDAITTRISDLRKSVNVEERAKLAAELQELEDRVFLKTLLPDVEKEIARRKKLSRIEQAIADVDTNKITRKSTELADSLITSAWRDRFAAEVSRLGIHHLRIELQREGGAYGTAKFRVALIRDSSVKLGTVLSEGEHRCIALAAFFAELATSDGKSALVFDDPVSSLDHDHREAVAKRLVDEASTGRQIIVFTHDVFLLDLLSRHAKDNNANVKFRTVSRLPDNSRSGAIDDDIPSSVAPAEDLAEGIRRQVKQFEGLHLSGRLVQWNAQTNAFSIQLRKCWERAVAEILSPVVERFNATVNTKNLWQIAAIEQADCVTMRTAYKRCSELNHESCAELHRTDPAPADYYAEVTAVKEWIQSVRAKQTAAQNSRR